MKELIGLAQAQSGKLAYAHGALPAQVAGEAFKSSAKVDMVAVPFKGSGPAMADVVGVQVPVILSARMAWTIRSPTDARAVSKATPLLARSGRRALRGEPAPAPATRAGQVLGQFALPARLETAPSPTWRQGIEQVARLRVRTKQVPAL